VIPSVTPYRSPLPALTSERLTSLSDTMFGVAMTLLASTLVPHIDDLKGAPLEMIKSLREPLLAVALSFAISAIYWISQQRRLAMTTVLTPGQTLLHMIFLFLIVLLPISTALFAHGASEAASVAIFGAHITLIAAANLALWIGVHTRVPAWHAVVPAALALAVIGGGFLVGLFHPTLAQYVWYAALLIGPVIRRTGIV
jgi:Endosomal/lysosomal potassium channel TMEM175